MASLGFTGGAVWVLPNKVKMPYSDQFDLGVRKIRLLTNNTKKVVGLEGYGLQIIERVPIQVPPNQHNRRYLKTKKDKLGHLLDEMD